MKKLLICIFLLVAFTSSPAIASEFQNFVEQAISDLRAAKNLDHNLDVNEIITSLNKIVKQDVGSFDNTSIITTPQSLKSVSDNSIENLTLLSLPVICIIITLIFSATINKPREINQQRILALKQVKLAAIDFSVTDEELLALRNTVKHLPFYAN